MAKPVRDRKYTATEIAQVIHEANRAQQRILGEEINPPWDEAPEWMRESTLQGVRGVFAGNGPLQSHVSWMETRLADGWVYGPVKDVARKISPCLVSYGDLPDAQKRKDRVFVAIAEALL